MENSRSYYTYISAKKKNSHSISELWQYRDLVALLTRKAFVLTYKQTILGPAWLIIHPLLSSAVYTIVFGLVAGMSTAGVPKLLFYLCSTAIWSLFSHCVHTNSAAFTANANLFGKVYFPRLTVPVSNLLVGLLKFGIQMIFVAAVLAWYVFHAQVTPEWRLFWILPVLLLQISLMGGAVGIIVSSLTTKYRDLAILVSFGLQLWMYASPVVYPAEQLRQGGLLRKLLLINPVTAPFEMFRRVFLGKGVWEPGNWLYSLAVTGGCLVLGILIFDRVERTVMDTV